MSHKPFKKLTQAQWIAMGGMDNPNLFRKSMGVLVLNIFNMSS